MGKKKPQANKAKTSFFPKITRFITESWKLIAVSFVSGLLLIAIVLQSISLYHNLQEAQKQEQERVQIEKDLVFWKKSLERYPKHRDIYFKIATLEYRLGNKEEAKQNLERALEIDPNFEKGRELEKILGT